MIELHLVPVNFGDKHVVEEQKKNLQKLKLRNLNLSQEWFIIVLFPFILF
jgi:hypothetical protein